MAAPLSLLLVDDDEIDRMAVQRALAAGRIEARYVECGDAASGLRALAAGSFDCVFLDGRLPDRDGLEVLRALRAGGDLTPVIVLTGFGDERLAVEVMKAGASDYFPKAGLHPERLAQSLRQGLRLRAAESAAASARLALHRHADQLRGLLQLSVAAHASRSPGEIASLLTAGARELLTARTAGLVDPARHCLSTAGEPMRELPLPGAVPPGRGQVLPAAELSEAERALLAPAAALPAREWLSVSVPGQPGEPAGLLYVFDKLAGTFNEADAAVLAQLAQVAGTAFANAQLVDELQRASRARDDLIAIVSHDLRNPLNVITMASNFQRQLLASPQPQLEAVRTSADRITRASRHMTALVNDLLDASRIESGALKLELQQTQAAELLDEVVEAFAPLASEKGIALSRGEAATGAAEADRPRLFQVLSNLVGNAIKFTPRGGSVSLGSREEGATVRFEVRDTGPGIDERHLPLLFKRYWQPGGVASREGAGLGLFIAQGIIQAHRGEISVETAPGKGSRFFFTVPAA